MKQVQTLAAVAAAILMIWAAVNVTGLRMAAEAQESPKDLKPGSSSKNVSPARDESKPPDERPYPVFCIDDVLVRLTTAADELIEKEHVKNSEELRQDLERTQFSMTLPRASSKELSPQELYRRACDSVFLVAGLTSRGRRERGLANVVFRPPSPCTKTASFPPAPHVFDHDDVDHAVVVMDVKGDVHPVVEVLAVDRESDTCLFRIGQRG